MKAVKRHIENSTHCGDFWVVVNENGERLTKIFELKREAADAINQIEHGVWSDLIQPVEWV
jgi:ABC-type enterochelin transport system substrate-binding protein